MWWECKIVVTAGLILIITAGWRIAIEDKISEVSRDRQLKNIQIALMYVLLALAMWCIWGPTQYRFKHSQNNPFTSMEKIEK